MMGEKPLPAFFNARGPGLRRLGARPGSLVVIIISLLLTAACVDLQVETKFKSNGSGVQVWHFTSSALMAGEIKKYVDSHPLLKHGKKLLDEYKKGEYWLSLEIPFEKVTELQADSREIRFQTKGWFKKTSTYSEFWKKQLGGSFGPLAEKTGAILPVKVKWQITMPGKIQESNADEINGAVATWNLTLTDFAAQHSFSARSTHWNVPVLAGTAAVALAILGLGWVGLQKHAQKRRIKCIGCGMIISSNSAYCSKCGKSQQETP